MDPAKVRELASKGGKAAHQQGVAHEFNSEEARTAGKKGGVATHRRRSGALKDATATSGATATDPKAGGKVVDVMCSSKSGCGARGVPVGSPEAAEAISPPYDPKDAPPSPDDGDDPNPGEGSQTDDDGDLDDTDASEPSEDDGDAQAVADGASADENPDQMGSCGKSGCGGG